MREIKFKGKKYLFGGDNLDESGFIATKSQYQNGELGYAHFYPDGEGEISRFGEIIGSRKDIVLGKEVEVAPKISGMVNLLSRFL